MAGFRNFRNIGVYCAVAAAVGIPLGMMIASKYQNRLLVEKNQTLTMENKALKAQTNEVVVDVRLGPIGGENKQETKPADFCPVTIGIFFDVAQILQNKTETCEQKLADAEQMLDDAKRKLDDVSGKAKRYKYESWLTLLRLRLERQKPEECKPAK